MGGPVPDNNDVHDSSNHSCLQVSICLSRLCASQPANFSGPQRIAQCPRDQNGVKVLLFASRTMTPKGLADGSRTIQFNISFEADVCDTRQHLIFTFLSLGDTAQ